MKFSQSVKLLTSLLFLATSKLAYAKRGDKVDGPILSAQPACEGTCFEIGSTSQASNQRLFIPVSENTFDVSIVKVEASGSMEEGESFNYFFEGDANASIGTKTVATGKDDGCYEEISSPAPLVDNSFYSVVVKKEEVFRIKPYHTDGFGFGFWVNVDAGNITFLSASTGCGNTNYWNLRLTIVENDSPPPPVIEDKCIPSKGTYSCEAVGGECVADCENNEEFVCIPELCSYDKNWDKERFLRRNEDDNIVELEIASNGNVNGRNLKGRTKSPKASKAPKATKAPKAAKADCSCRVPNFTGYVLSEAPSLAPTVTK